MELNKQNIRKLVQIIAYTILLYLGAMKFEAVWNTFLRILGILQPFIVGGCIAFILGIPMKFIEENIFKKSRPHKKVFTKLIRPLSILLSILFVVGIILIVIFTIEPQLEITVVNLIDTIPGFINRVSVWVNETINNNPQLQEVFSEYSIDWNHVSKLIMTYAQDFFSGTVSSATGIVSSILDAVTTIIIGFVFAIYLLANKETHSRQAKKLCYSFLKRKKADRFIAVFQLTHETFSRFISGQCLEAVILGMMFFITLTILRYPYTLLIGVLISFTALIPILGAWIGSAISFVLIFMVNPIQALWFIVIFNVLQQIEGNFIYPHVVGGSVGLPSLWVLFAVTIGGSLMGVLGMLVFIPLLSVFYKLLRENVNTRLLIRKISPDKFQIKKT